MTDEISTQISNEVQTLSQIQYSLIKSTNKNLKQPQSLNLSSISKPLQESVNTKINEIDQYQNIIVDFMNILFYLNKDFSIEKVSETISNLQEQLNSFRSSISLRNDKQNEMGIIDAFNFLLQNCINSYNSFNNILSLLFEQPKTYSFQSIESKTETSIQNLISQTSQLSISIIGESSNLSENSPLEQIINEISISTLKSINNISKHFSQKDTSTSQSQQNSLLSFFNYLLDDSNRSFPIVSKIHYFLNPTIQSNKF
jgi:hypothetical protein